MGLHFFVLVTPLCAREVKQAKIRSEQRRQDNDKQGSQGGQLQKYNRIAIEVDRNAVKYSKM